MDQNTWACDTALLRAFTSDKLSPAPQPLRVLGTPSLPALDTDSQEVCLAGP